MAVIYDSVYTLPWFNIWFGMKHSMFYNSSQILRFLNVSFYEILRSLRIVLDTYVSDPLLRSSSYKCEDECTGFLQTSTHKSITSMS